MIDFLTISTKSIKKDVVEIYPKFIIKKSSDLMIRGSDFYAIWLEERGLWSTDEHDVLELIDRELDNYVEKNKKNFDPDVRIRVLYMWDAGSGMIDAWHKYCQKQMRDSFVNLDDNLIFANHKTTKKDYASRRLPYPLEKGDISAYDRLMSVIYSEEERHKIEWAIGSIVQGDSKKIQKFMVLYGAAGTGKSTVLNIIQQLFEGYYSVFDAKALGSSNNSFALEAFKSNPLIAIQHDGDLSRIEDNTRLNSLVSHEMMTVNEKFKSAYSSKFKSFLFLGTNKPVKITDAKSGLIRRLIDVSPSGNKLSIKEYRAIMKQISFELGAIAYHCKEVYLSNPGKYDDYIPLTMLGASNDFYNFMVDSYHIFSRDNETTLKAAWEMYNEYCDSAKVQYPFAQRAFKEELKNYFKDFKERFSLDDGSRVRSFYTGFRHEKFGNSEKKKEESVELIDFKEQNSIFDVLGSGYPAQYANEEETPIKKWENVKTTLFDIDTSKLHYVKIPEQHITPHIVMDFDIKDDKGEKNLSKNIEEASKFPPTYAELSKSGKGVHLHYYYDGDVRDLSRVYDDGIEVKIFTGNGSLRRKLTKCNDLPIATINSGLPLKGEKMINFEGVKNEKALRTLIKRNLNKEIHPATKPSIDFIFKILDDAYSSGMSYDISDMFNQVLIFASESTNQSDYCLKRVKEMKFKSEEPSASMVSKKDLIFYDVEVFPNLFIVSWKFEGEDQKIVRMINPDASRIEELLEFNLVGFNCRRYDNHILYGALLGYDNLELYKLSQRIINGGKNCFFNEAYNISYTDIYDFSAIKQSLKKWQIELGITHKELGLPWDQPVPEPQWLKVAEYCDNDVLATEALFNHLKSDFLARQILADVAGMTVNDTTNTLTTRIIFGKERKPQSQFHYRNLAEPVHDLDEGTRQFLTEVCPTMMSKTHGPADSLLPYFPGYVYERGVSTYRGEEVGEGGYVYSEPGMYGNVALLDIVSMHPYSTIAECLFGPKFTRAYYDVVYSRVNIKHESWDIVNTMLEGKLTPFIQKVINGEMTSGDLANALKIAINSVYGLTAANFDNPFRDIRNKDNIVAKRGALFMVNLKHEVQARGFTVAHIKTDSIKIPNATEDIINFVMEYGKAYGYNFEHESTYEKMCLVNDAVFIAKDEGEWSATGTQFAVPYVFKKLFDRDSPIVFDDLCETKSVTTALYLDMNESLPDVSAYEKELDKLMKEVKNSESLDDEVKNKIDYLNDEIAKGHNYIFVGKVGRFTPIKEGCNGGILVREKDGKYHSASGAKGFRWLEAEMVKGTEKENDVDVVYYNRLVDAAVDTLKKFGDVEWFIS